MIENFQFNLHDFFILQIHFFNDELYNVFHIKDLLVNRNSSINLYLFRYH